VTLLSEIGVFAEKLRSGMQQFRRDEMHLRTQYAIAENVTPESMPASMLERPTRRFLIDHFLRALDWNPDNPGQVIEEARAHSASNDRLYFDYLGVSPTVRAPVLIVEAKAFDVPKPRRVRGSELDAKGMGQLICEAVFALKDDSQKNSGIIAEWAEYLKDLHGYVSSLNEFGRRTLRRVVITAGNWVIVFEEPIACFVTAGQPIAERVHCFPSGDEILLRHAELYEMLQRRRLVDTLPLALDVPEALEFLPPDKIGDCYRAVMVATSATTGAERKKYPTRSVYPAVLVNSSDRWFAILDLDRWVEEPKGSERIEDFLRSLEQAGSDLEGRLRARLGLPLLPRPLEQFPGFSEELTRQRATIPEVPPLPGSTSARAASQSSRTFVVHSGEPGAPAEFVVVTGTRWFYKSDHANTPSDCKFHYWKEARKAGVSSGDLQAGCSVVSFTEDGQDRHCAHGDLRSIRTQRCHVLPLESQMCCQSCAFVVVCWNSDRARLPCPTE
jgi:hypothetical protein